MNSRAFMAAPRITRAVAAVCRNNGSFQPARGMASSARWELNVPVPVLAVFPITTFCLGVWQMRRLEWKTNLIKKMEDRAAGLPVQLPEDPYAAAELEHARVVVRGVFEHSKEMYVGPRSEITQGESKPGRIGAVVITPLRRTDHDSTILVNRGFVPAEKLNPKARPETQVDGEQLVIGYVKRGEEAMPYMPANRPDKNEWRWIDLMQMADWVNARPIIVYAARDGKPGAIPAGSQFQQEKLSNNHGWYAFTWFSLALISGAMTVARFRRRGFR